jgi:hypothetical protein
MKQQNETNQNSERKFLLVFVGLCGGAFILSFLLPAHAAIILCQVVLAFLFVTYVVAAWWLWLD